MDSIAAQLVSNDNCGQDLKAQNPVVVRALSGLRNYYIYYGAGCLKDNATGIYCIHHSTFAPSDPGYTLAITNSSNPADAAAYYLPTIPLISGARPSCSGCTQQLFNVYNTFASNSTLDISKNYLQAAQIVDLNCGVDFVSVDRDKISGGWRGYVLPWGFTILMSWGVGMALGDFF